MRTRATIALLAALAAAACGGGGAATEPDPGGGTPSPDFAELRMSPTGGSVEVGGTFQLSAVPMDAAGAPVLGLPAAAWTTGDASRATVDATGLVTGVAEGTVTVSATLTAGGSTRTASAQLTVLPRAPALASVRVTPEQVTLAVGASAALTAAALDAAGQPIAGLPAPSFSTSDAGRATVDASGTVTAVAPGTAVVTASVSAGGVTRTGSATVVVSSPVSTSALVQGIGHAFVPAAVTIAPGGTVTWRMVDEEHDVTWTGALAPPGGNIEKIDEGEQASRTFPAAGVYTYRCERHDNHEETGTVTVSGGDAGAPVLTSVAVTPAAPSVSVGATVQLAATPLDQLGRPMSVPGAPAWSSADPARATVSASGLVTGVSAGSVAVRATFTHGGQSRTGSATVAVGGGTQPGGATVSTPGESFAPPSVTIAPGGAVTWQFSGARHNVTFTGAAPTGGNIPDTEPGRSVSRSFPAAGTYDYTCTRHGGMNGRVVVQ